MTKIQNLFKKDITRDIETVVKADDKKKLLQEIKEYVFTNEIESMFTDQDLFAQYREGNKSANAVWISGFFGSGKSHLLKILSIVLENRVIDGENLGEIFLEKIKEDYLKADVKSCFNIPSKSILFNIDQKSDITSKSDEDAVLSVFNKVFNEMCGFYGGNGHVADFERYLDKEEKYETFKEIFNQKSGKTWDEARMDYMWENDNITETLSDIFNKPADDFENILETYENNYKLSIDSFCEKVWDYIKHQEPNFRLNFFVDEVGQYISDNTKLMLNLQTIAETLATKCNGRSWVLVTSQDDISKIMGNMNAMQENDFSRIQARFKMKIDLSSKNVDEVIEKRLLEKKDDIIPQIEDLFNKEEKNLETVLSFKEGVKFNNYRDKEDFTYKYPFAPYQFDLFQLCIKALSSHNAFQGKHASVGERSMLSVFQDVVIGLESADLGTMVTFDQLYGGIKSTMRSEIKTAINMAEKNIQNEYAVKVLKALFLVKYVNQFKTNIRNIQVLMTNDINTNPEDQQTNLKTALNELESQSYITRNGEYYEFLTNDEKDIEDEIKNEELHPTDVPSQINKIVFEDLLGQKKIKYELNKQDYELGQKIDGEKYSKEKDLYINIITPANESYSNPNDISRFSIEEGNSLHIRLAESSSLIKDLILFIKTKNYITPGKISSSKPSVERLLIEKQRFNTQRYTLIKRELEELIGNGDFYLNGNKLSIENRTNAKTKITEGFQYLIELSYSNLKMLQGINYTDATIKKVFETKKDDFFTGTTTTETEAEQEIINILKLKESKSERSTLKNIRDHFMAKPYGWSQSATFTLLAQLLRRGKLDLKMDSNILDDSNALKSLTNNRLFDNTTIKLQITFNDKDIKRIKDLFKEFFDSPCDLNEVKDIANSFQEKLTVEKDSLLTIKGNINNYLFLSVLDPVIDEFDRLQKMDYSTIITNSKEFEDRLLDYKEDIIDPVTKFWNSEQKVIFDSVTHFLREKRSNFIYLNSEHINQLEDVMAASKPFERNIIKDAKTVIDSLKDEEKTLVKHEQESASTIINSYITEVKNSPGYDTLNEDDKEKILYPLTSKLSSVQRESFISNIKKIEEDVKSNSFTESLNLLTEAIKKEKPTVTPQSDEGASAVAEPQPTIKNHITLSTIKIKTNLTKLDTEADIDTYLSDLKSELLKQINDNKTIHL